MDLLISSAVTPLMQLKPNCGSDRAWVWSTLADFADEESKEELLAIRFANAESEYLQTGCRAKQTFTLSPTLSVLVVC